MKRISVSIVEDSDKYRRGLTILLNNAPDMRCRSAFANAEKALAQLPADAPDIVLMDIHMPGMGGIEGVARLARLMPKVRIVMLTAYEDNDDIIQTLSNGAHGYLVKSAEPETLLEAIREVAAGGSPISGSVARKIVDFLRAKPAGRPSAVELAPREQAVLRLLADGCPYKEIGARMQVSISTVRTYIVRIYEKLHVHSRTEAVVKFLGTPPGPASAEEKEFQ
ncbi:MAG: response regulator transcription factor [bacterium]